jgi:hypothetical protein
MILTKTDILGLQLIAGHGGVMKTRPSDIGMALYPNPKHGGRDHRSAQGMALAGGKAMYRLQAMKLISMSFNGTSFLTTYELTSDGKTICEDLSELEESA